MKYIPPLRIWLAAAIVAVLAGVAAIGFRTGFGALQYLFYGITDERISELASALPWWHRLLAPIAGGCVVAVVLRRFMPGARPRSIAAAIAAGEDDRPQITAREGLGAAAISALTLGAGGSAGREGPVVHLAAWIAAAISQRLGLDGTAWRVILAAAIASVTSASFHAPLAGLAFAIEIVLRRDRLTALGPAILAAVIGDGMYLLSFGDVPLFAIPPIGLPDPEPLFKTIPAGLAATVAALAFMHTLLAVEQGVASAERRGWPGWLTPVPAGLAVGIIAAIRPEVIGVGYGTTETLLLHGMASPLLVALIAAKIAATSVTLGGRFGGGIFSPCLMLGVAAGAFVATDSGGMVAGLAAAITAVLGGPVTGILMAWELTGQPWAMAYAVIAAGIAWRLGRRVTGGSIFTLQARQAGTR